MKDGGPAFPTEIKIAQVTHEEREILDEMVNTISLPGMSLRDYFAVKAMQSLIPVLKHIKNDVNETKQVPTAVAETAYEFADAMIAAREAVK